MLRGTPSEDVVYALDGNDRILTGGGFDIVLAGAGDDRVRMGPGEDDLAFGENGKDVLEGEDGPDGLFGGDGDDRLLGGRGPGRSCKDRAVRTCLWAAPVSIGSWVDRETTGSPRGGVETRTFSETRATTRSSCATASATSFIAARVGMRSRRIGSIESSATASAWCAGD